MTRKLKRPEPFRISGTNVRVRVAAGPDSEGRWYWRADYQEEGGKRPTVWVGWGTALEAERAVLQVLAQEDEEPVPSAEVVTVEDLLSTWTAAVDERADVTECTRRSCTGAAKRLLKHGLGQVRVDRIDRRAIERHRDSALRSSQGGATVQRDLKHLRSAWTWARELGLVPDRELPRVPVERKARKAVYTRHTPSRAEIGQMLGLVRPEWVRRALVLLACTGARIGEVATLTWGRVAVDGSTVLFVGKTSTEDEPRVVPLHPSVAAELRRWARGEPGALVLGVSPKRAVTRTQAELRRVSAELGIPGVSPNGLRRAMTDALYDAGLGPDVEAAILGHSAQTALGIYRAKRLDGQGAAAVIRAGITLPVPEGEVIDLSDRLSRPAKAQVGGGGKYSQGD